LKLCQRSCYAIQTCQLPKFIWEKSAILRRFDGSTTCTGKISEIRAEAEALIASARLCQRADFEIDQGLYPYSGQNQLPNTKFSDIVERRKGFDIFYEYLGRALIAVVIRLEPVMSWRPLYKIDNN
jgi:hypothetical protein